MKIFRVYIQPQSADLLEEAIFVPEGFSFWAFIFDAFWMVYYRLWLAAVILFAAIGILGYLEFAGTIGLLVPAVIRFAIKAYIGFTAHDWHAFFLKRKGFVLTDIIAATDITEAQLKFYRNYTDIPETSEAIA